MQQRDPYDGTPYFCTSCGEFLNPADCKGGDCNLESDQAAQRRAAKRRPGGSDLATFKKAASDAA